MDFRHLIVTCLFSKLRLPFDNQKVKENYAILKIKIRVTSLDTVLYRGKRVIDSTFRYRIDNIPSIVIACRANSGITLWDTLRTPDYFWLEY